MSALKPQDTRALARGAIIAALYTALTVLLAPLSYGEVQIRFSEAFTLLPILMPEAVPALLVGCLLANILGGCTIFDIVFGSLATLLAALCTRRLREKFTALRTAGTIGPLSRICMIDDGSRDETWQIISDLHTQDPVFSGIRLSRNRGHQNALLCGLMTLRDRADCVISMDADLQDDINAIDAMLAAFRDGNDIVYGVRASRKQDSAFKRASAQGYYRLLRALGADVVYNHADYRLMSRRALDALAEYKEVNLFLRGLVPLVGYPSTVVYYERGKRFAGESKYPLRKMLSFAWEGVSSLTVSPLRLITRIGVVMFLVSIAMLIYFLVRYFTGHTVAGWSSLAVSIWAIGGLQLLAIGVVGEYIGKIYLETKARPRYRIETELDDREAEL